MLHTGDGGANDPKTTGDSDAAATTLQQTPLATAAMQMVRTRQLLTATLQSDSLGCWWGILATLMVLLIRTTTQRQIPQTQASGNGGAADSDGSADNASDSQSSADASGGTSGDIDDDVSVDGTSSTDSDTSATGGDGGHSTAKRRGCYRQCRRTGHRRHGDTGDATAAST
jgi:hypothetical protein